MASNRVIVHLDVDCFYAQSEILRRPSLQDRPVGITQKFLVVTSNYVARNLGVPKMASVEEAKRRCPDIVLINGEDLTPYRAASKSIMAVFRRFGVLERRGLDECAVDATEEVERRAEAGYNVETFAGIVLGQGKDDQFANENLHLMLGTHVAAEMRIAVERETGFQCSCGIAQNKMLAKLTCSLNKPNKQTCILPSAVSEFLLPLPVRKIPGVGSQTQDMLKEMGVHTLADLLRLSLLQLSSRLRERVGKLLFDACRGRDEAPVQENRHQKSLSVEDSFKPRQLEEAKEILYVLAPDLISRLDEDKEETGRRPKTLTVKWRSRGAWNFTSISAQIPDEVVSTSLKLERRTEVLVETAMKLLAQSLQGRAFCVLNIGATNFVSTTQDASPSGDIRSFFKRGPSSSFFARDGNFSVPEASGPRDNDLFFARVPSVIFRNEEKASIRREVGNPATCAACEKAVDRALEQEHMDFHFAMQLHFQENRQIVEPRYDSKRRRRNATLDSFVLKADW